MLDDSKQNLSTNKWHLMKVGEVMQTLKTGKRGLSEEEAKRRLEVFGPNQLVEEKRITPLGIFLNQFKSVLIMILIISALIAGLILHEFVDMYAILIIVIMNAILGFVQEYRAEKAVEALKRMVAPMARGIRGSRERLIPTKELVPGDVIILDEGVRVPADARLMETISLKVNEAPLTGESVPIDKKIEALHEDVSLTDRTNMVSMGTNVTFGRGKAVVTATGMETNFGKIAEMVQAVEAEEPPLKKRVERLGTQLGIVSLVLCVFIFIVMFLVHEFDIVTVFLTSVSMAVSAIPEGLPAVITITLAIGVSRMARQRAIVRKLASVETLGCTTVICSDKTGTLTKNEMTIRKIYYNDKVVGVTGSGYEPKGKFLDSNETNFNPKEDEDLSFLLRIGSLCNNSVLEKENEKWFIVGDPTEGALVVSAAKAGIWREEAEKQFTRIDEVPFSSERKRMTTVHSVSGEEHFAFVKGAPEVILERCTLVLEGSEEKELNEIKKRKILEVNEMMASEALRVLGMAYKRLPGNTRDFSDEELENRLTFVGLEGMIDPPREEVATANKLCEQAGIKSVMITGDHKLTAIAVAKEIGMLKKKGLTLTGIELNKMSDTEFEKIVEDVVVYARVSPEHKTRIVEALKVKGHIVAMTGDGVNDAPAIKTADIGVAMGIKGTDVTKEASDMVLEDDNFATIVTAVEGGRHIYENIKKYIRLMITANFDEFFEIAVASLAGLPLPLLPIQILWINLVTDGLPAVALSIDPKDPELMQRPPRNPKEGFLRRIWRFLLFGATLDFLSDFVPYLWVLTAGFINWGLWDTSQIIRARTMAFTSITFFEFFLAYNCRSETHSIFGLGWKGIFANKMLFLSVLVAVLLQLAIIYVPFLQNIFQTAPLSPLEISICAIGACSGLLIFPGKLISRKKHHKN